MSGQPRLLKYIETISYIFLVLNVLIVPLFIDKNLVNSFVIPKQYLFIGFVLLNLLFVAGRTILLKRFEYRHSVIDIAVLLVLGAGLLSAIFSVAGYDSFVGRNEYFVVNFVYLLFLALFYFLITSHLTTRGRWQTLLDTLVAVGGVTALVFILKVVFHVELPSVFPQVWNTTDSVNSTFGIWLVVTFILSAGYLIKKEISVARLLVYFLIAILSLVSLVLLSFKILWWILLIGLVLLLLLGVSFVKEARLGWLSVLFAALVMVVIFITFNTPKSFQSNIPPEVSLGAKPSWSIANSTMFSGLKSFFIGSGLGTFGVDFSRFRDADFNNDSVAWSLRFNQPFSNFFALLSEGGVAVVLSLIFIVLFVLGHVLVVWLHARSEGHRSILEEMVESSGGHIETFLVVIAWLLVSVAGFVVFFGPTLWWLWWLLLGLIVTGLSFLSGKIFHSKKITIEDTPQYNLSFSFVLIVVMAAVIMLGVWGVRLYLAEVAYAQAIRSTNFDEMETKLKQALARRASVDNYYVALAQVYLARATELSRQPKPNVPAISTLMAQAVNSAKQATDLAPKSALIWSNLATMYENAAMILPSAREWAIKSLLEAKDLEPTNPVLWWRLGNNYSLAGQRDEAIKHLREAINLKKDYLNPYLSLAALYEESKDLDKAADMYRVAFTFGSNNVDVLFNFGRLLFNRNHKGDRADAEKLWLEAIRIQPNYSNALYSLGLLYEAQGNKTAALQYYYKVKDLNPENKDITSKISSMVNSR